MSTLCLANTRRVSLTFDRNGAPTLSRSLEGPPVLNKYGQYEITETTTYEESGDNPDTRPITFLDGSASTSNGDLDEKFYSLLPESEHGSEAVKTYDVCKLGEFLETDTFLPEIVDNELEEFVVGDSEKNLKSHTSFEFHTLYPGQSITSTTRLHPDGIYQEDFRLGERYTYRFNGKVLRWWDWGTMEVSSSSH